MITLSPTEVKVAEWIGKERMYSAIRRQVKNSQVSDIDRLVIDTEGAAAELAFCKLFNL
jgi:hypothetical protein